MRKVLLKKVLLFVSSLLVALITVETCLRLFRPVTYRDLPRQLPGDVWRELLHGPSALSGLDYELTPNREKHSHGSFIRTNSWGMRDDEPGPRNDDLHRIVAIGDSFTFGFGVSGQDTYPNVLERLLNAGLEAKRFEVLNLGVGGYSTRDEALVLKHKGIAWDPELVIVGYFFNDPEIEPIQPLHYYHQQPSWWQYSHLLRLIAERKKCWEIDAFGEGDYYRYLHSADRPKWQSVVEGFGQIGRTARESGVPVVLLIFPVTADNPWKDYPYADLHQQVADAAEEKGFFVIDLLKQFSEYPPRELMVGPINPHPSELGHETTAQAVYQWVLANGGESYSVCRQNAAATGYVR